MGLCHVLRLLRLKHAALIVPHKKGRNAESTPAPRLEPQSCLLPEVRRRVARPWRMCAPTSVTQNEFDV